MLASLRVFVQLFLDSYPVKISNQQKKIIKQEFVELIHLMQDLLQPVNRPLRALKLPFRAYFNITTTLLKYLVSYHTLTVHLG